jgi:hypothetical protein
MYAELPFLSTVKLDLSSRKYEHSCHKILILTNMEGAVKTVFFWLDIDDLVKYLMELVNFLNPKFLSFCRLTKLQFAVHTY